MERDYNDHYYGNSRHDADRDRDRKRGYESRYSGGRDRYSEGESGYYRNRDYDMENDYYSQVSNSHHDLENIRQGYGFPSFGSRADDRYDEIERMKRERQAQRMQGYGSGRMGGYSGSAFGGANYSSHGDFGGSRDYGSMSGYGGNAGHDVSSSGYGGGYSSRNAPSQRKYTDNWDDRSHGASRRDADDRYYSSRRRQNDW